MLIEPVAFRTKVMTVVEYDQFERSCSGGRDGIAVRFPKERIGTAWTPCLVVDVHRAVRTGERGFGASWNDAGHHSSDEQDFDIDWYHTVSLV